MHLSTLYLLATTCLASPVVLDPEGATVTVSLEISENFFQIFQARLAALTTVERNGLSVAIVGTNGIVNPQLLRCETFDAEGLSFGKRNSFTISSRSGISSRDGTTGAFIGTLICNLGAA
ncbi:hypothetical protein JX265_010433 [Neoarthrinium moseri]|uniref:Uncharacterized protein n=1 Tax=Neoarthrinium moseri TaxID=1658444 RepID=A0A9Q0ALU2_9PEZI|nr:hypothetical protein JX266_012821 [Neoarthrinium moseri]KAI1859430.1 hypothetical protein JX265_010433 [Neoarthrinium moseri]